MEPFTNLTARAVPLVRPNIDTEIVIRIDRLIEFKRGELGPYCFESWRTLADGSEDPAFPLNQDRYRGARILVAGENFGCGSSREAAVWSLMDFGIRCVIAPSFGDIFTANCLQNGVLAICLPGAEVARIAAELDRFGGELRVDLVAQQVTSPGGHVLPFTIDAQAREALIAGLDEVDLTLRLRDQILAYRDRTASEHPWVIPADART